MRGLTLDLHRPIEAALGLCLAVIPLLLTIGGQVDFSTLGLILALLLGGIIATLGFAGGRGGEVVTPSLHSALDYALTGGLAVAALLFALAGDGWSALTFGLAVILFGVLTLATRYVGEGDTPRVR